MRRIAALALAAVVSLPIVAPVAAADPLARRTVGTGRADPVD